MSEKSEKKVEITFIRAGKTKSGMKNAYLGWNDEPLLGSEKNKIEKRVALEVYPKVSRVYTSPLLRCRETAYLIYKNIPAILENGFSPFDIGVIEGNIYGDFRSKDDSNVISLGESSFIFTARVENAFNHLIEEIKTTSLDRIAVITHEKVIKVILRKYTIPRSIHSLIKINYAGGVSVEYDYSTNLSLISNQF